MPGSIRHIEPLLPTGQTISPAGIASAEAWGTPTVLRRFAQAITPAGIASAQVFGTATVIGGARVIRPAGITPAEAVGRPTVARGTITLRPGGIASAEAFGVPAVTFGHIFPIRQTVAPGGIASQETFGAPAVVIVTPSSIYPAGWAELELFGIPSLSRTPTVIRPAGIVSGQALGLPILVGFAAAEGPVARTPRNYLIDRVTREVYPWPVNHQSEDSIRALGRQLQPSGVNPGGFMIRQPTHPGPVQLNLHGHMIDHSQAQYQTFVRFFRESDDRTFDYIDASGDSYHVAVIGFDARRKASPAHVDGSYFEYSLQVEVISVNQGALAGHAV